MGAFFSDFVEVATFVLIGDSENTFFLTSENEQRFFYSFKNDLRFSFYEIYFLISFLNSILFCKLNY